MWRRCGDAGDRPSRRRPRLFRRSRHRRIFRVARRRRHRAPLRGGEFGGLRGHTQCARSHHRGDLGHLLRRRPGHRGRLRHQDRHGRRAVLRPRGTARPRLSGRRHAGHRAFRRHTDGALSRLLDRPPRRGGREAGGIPARYVGDLAQLEARAAEIAGNIARNAPLSVRASKAAIRAVLSREPADVEQALELGNLTFGSDDYREGREAFRQKRPPRFEGR